MKVIKFSEDALSTVAQIKTAVKLITDDTGNRKPVIVLSAFPGVRSLLESAAGQAEAGRLDFADRINEIREIHLHTLKELLPAREQAGVVAPIQILLNDLEDILHGVQLIRECSPRTRDLVLSFGVQLCSHLFAHYMRYRGLTVQQVDARELIVSDHTYGNAQVDFQASNALIADRFARSPADEIGLILGGIAAADDGATTLLRDVDFSASLIAAALDAASIEIWTDQDGITSADLRFVPEAFVIDQLKFEEAMEMAYFGAKVLHPQALVPAMEHDIPICFGNINRPAQSGTIICNRIRKHSTPITSIASIDRVALVNIEGGGMIGVPGIAARIFTTLARASVNIMMISQASSEHSICLAFMQPEAEIALSALQTELTEEIRLRKIQNFELVKDVAIIAIIGENMRGTPGISGTLFSALGQAGINVLAIAQGSSERNISFLVENGDEGKAIHTVYQAFLEEGIR